MSLSTNSLLDYIKIDLVWAKGHPIPGQDLRAWRLDAFGNIINRDQYGQRNAPHGWEIDHILPKAIGGGDEMENLRPLHWRRNASHGGILGNLLGG